MRVSMRLIVCRQRRHASLCSRSPRMAPVSVAGAVCVGGSGRVWGCGTLSVQTVPCAKGSAREMSEGKRMVVE